MREPPTRRTRTSGSSTVRPPRCRFPMRRSTSWFRSRRSSIWPVRTSRGCSPKSRAVLTADGVLVLSAPNPVEYCASAQLPQSVSSCTSPRATSSTRCWRRCSRSHWYWAAPLLRVRDLERAARGLRWKRGRATRQASRRASPPAPMYFLGRCRAQRGAAGRRGKRRLALFRSQRRRAAAAGWAGGRGHAAGPAAGRARRRARPADRRTYTTSRTLRRIGKSS